MHAFWAPAVFTPALLRAPLPAPGPGWGMPGRFGVLTQYSCVGPATHVLQSAPRAPSGPPAQWVVRGSYVGRTWVVRGYSHGGPQALSTAPPCTRASWIHRRAVSPQGPPFPVFSRHRHQAMLCAVPLALACLRVVSGYLSVWAAATSCWTNHSRGTGQSTGALRMATNRAKQVLQEGVCDRDTETVAGCWREGLQGLLSRTQELHQGG